jgi:hypothetical protein
MGGPDQAISRLLNARQYSDSAPRVIRSSSEGRTGQVGPRTSEAGQQELLALIKARLDQLDRFWEKEQTKADIEVVILDKIFTKLPTPPFSVGQRRPV